MLRLLRRAGRPRRICGRAAAAAGRTGGRLVAGRSRRTRRRSDPIGALAQRRITDAAAAARPMTHARAQRLLARPRRHRSGVDPDHPWRGLLAATYWTSRPTSRPGRRRSPERRQPQRRAHGRVAGADPALPRHQDPHSGGHGPHQRRRQTRLGAHRARPPGGQRRDAHPARAAPTGGSRWPRRSDRDSLAEELRRLDPDEVYAEVLTEGLKLLHDKGSTKTARSGGGSRHGGRTPPRAALAGQRRAPAVTADGAGGAGGAGGPAVVRPS